MEPSSCESNNTDVDSDDGMIHGGGLNGDRTNDNNRINHTDLREGLYPPLVHRIHGRCSCIGVARVGVHGGGGGGTFCA